VNAIPPTSLTAPAQPFAGVRLSISVGVAVRWRGEAWIVTAVHYHPRLGTFARLEDGLGGYDLVHLNGFDGAIEALEPTP